eukprot:TRINITY_DN8302_c0_g1_i2.p2 TRINITY_DN8302_c0_g1~~TRINITY_DN8302_c0_g1_i2.p2  ORF type:complete len:100 (-),score=25.10 TRINITY_DN8302_c0_g1_i2:116-376(-)
MSSEQHSKEGWVSRWFTSIQTDRPRFKREFYDPDPHADTGNYYPRYQVDGSMESASVHVPFLSRPYYSYKVPSVYGYPKFITVRKL